MADILHTILIWWIPVLTVMTLIIVVHELGHFLVAKWCGVAIDQFSVGFGRPLWSRRDRAGVEWRIGWLPLGGYVKFAGDTNVASVPDQSDLDQLRTSIIQQEGVGAEKKYLFFKPLWQRAAVVVAGPAANFLLATVLFAIFLGTWGEAVTTPKLLAVVPGEAAAQAGFQPGDLVLAADGRSMSSFEDVAFYVQYRAGIPIDFTVLRAQTRLHILATPKPLHIKNPINGDQVVGRLGIEAIPAHRHVFPPMGALAGGLKKTVDATGTTLFMMGQIATGHAALDQLQGLVGIVHATGAITQQVAENAREAHIDPLVPILRFLIEFAASLSVGVGILNLLPIPVLDGGHLLFYAYELVVRRPPRAMVQAVAFRTGALLLIGLMLFVNLNELFRLGAFHFLGSLFS